MSAVMHKPELAPQSPPPTPGMAKLFKSHQTSMTYYFRHGTKASFIQGRYFTQNQLEINELMHEIQNNHPILYLDPEELEVDPLLQTPDAMLRAKYFEEFKRQYINAQDPTNDRGTSASQQFNPTSTADVAAAAAGGDGRTAVSQIAALRKLAEG